VADSLYTAYREGDQRQNCSPKMRRADRGEYCEVAGASALNATVASCSRNSTSR